MTRADTRNPSESVPGGSCLEPGTLWSRLKATTERALASGALQPIPTSFELVEDQGVSFVVRMFSNLERKAEARKQEKAQQERTGTRVDPFLPYDPDMFVSDLSETHVCILNKFNVLEHHLLIITRAFEDQETLLTLEDFEAMWLCLQEFEGLAFYNGGEMAGASQPHKHLQMVPLPLSTHGPRVPVEELFPAVTTGTPTVQRLPLPFLHGYVPLTFGDASPRAAAGSTRQHYDALLRATGLAGCLPPSGLTKQSGPYNLLVTRNWMLLVPRSAEFFERMSVNALGFAGALLVRNAGEMARLKTRGPMAALEAVAPPA